MRWKAIAKNCIIVGLFSVLLLSFALFLTYFARGPTPYQQYGMYEVVEVDGVGNIVVDKGEVRQRVFLIGIDFGEKQGTPEWKNAKEYMQDTVLHKEVSLEYDVARNKDSTLHVVDYAYVYLDDGRMLNAVLISEGITDYTRDAQNRRYDKKLRLLETQAKQNKVGIWGESQER